MEEASRASSAFALDLFKQLAKANESENIFFSPISIFTTLSMLFQGARGDTAAQIAELLHFKKVQGDGCSLKATTPRAPLDMEQQIQKPAWSIPTLKPSHCDASSSILSGFQALISEINKTNNKYLLKTANNLYAEKSYEISNEYLKLFERYYHAKPQAVDFATAAEDARKEINTWVEKQTESKIKNLLPEGSVNSLTALVLVSANYFKANWEKRFEKSDTKEAKFRLSKKTSKPVQMMFKKDKCDIYHDDLLETMFLKLPYVENHLDMVILLPDDINDNSTGLEKLENELTLEKLMECTSPDMMEKVSVEIFLPRMKFEEKYDLKETLCLMGMRDAFIQGEADLSGISKRKDLQVSQIFHKAYVEVNEEGTEAAAATGATVMKRSREVSVTLRADHPFIFYIVESKTKAMLFAGKVISP